MAKDKDEPKVAPANYDKVETDGKTLDSKSEKANGKRGSSYQGNPTDPFDNHTKSVIEKTKTDKKPAPSKKEDKEDLNRRSRPEPTPDLEETSNREDG